MRGHLIDHKDTMRVGPRENWSTYDRRNYIPEPPEYEWGLGFRRLKVAELSKRGGAYSQINEYDEDPLIAEDGTLVPSNVRFIAYSLESYQKNEVFHVQFEESMKRPSGRKVLEYASETISTSVNNTPFSILYDINSNDRSLRLQIRNLRKQENEIYKDVTVRFPEKDAKFHAYAAADRSFESVDPITHAVVSTYDEQPKSAQQYIKYGLSFFSHLNEVGEKNPITPDGKKEINSFLKTQVDEGEMEEVSDQFKKLMADAR